MTSKRDAKAKARAAWRAWYRRHHEEAKAYYRKRYAQRLKEETPKERELRLARGRRNQKRYARRKKEAKNVHRP